MDQPRFKATYKGAVIGWYDTADEALAAIEAADAQDEWDRATHLLANVLKEMLDTCVYGEGFSGDELQKLKVLIGWRDRKQEAFLRAVAGAPGKPK